MVNSSKVLTVSYGTFSCTLEGFDDSFSMMKAIAEYFRDLAADDRYFGAEPPTPDTEMLARIAEREVERRVEARLEKGNIVLRPSLAVQNVAEPAAAETPATPVAEPVAAATTEPQTASAPVDAPVAPAAAVAGAAVAGLVAAEVTAQEDTATEAEAAESADLPDAEETAAVPKADAEIVADQTPEAGSDDADDAAEVDLASISALLAEEDTAEVEAIADTAEEDESAGAEVSAAAVAPDVTSLSVESVAAKLQRIRAVVSKHDAPTEKPADFSEDEHAETLDDGIDDDIDIASVSALLSEQAEAETDTVEEDENLFAEDDETEESSIDALLAAVSDDLDDTDEDTDEDADDRLFDADGDDVAESEEDDLVAGDDAAPVNETAAAAAAMAAILDQDDDEDDWDDDDDWVDEDLAFDDDEDENATDAVAQAEDDDDDAGPLGVAAAATAAVAAATVAAEPVRAAVQARVTKIKRADFDAAVARGDLEEVEDDAQETVAVAETTRPRVPLAETSTLSDEDEDDLASELAELEAEIAAEEGGDLDAGGDLPETAEEAWDDEDEDDWDDEADLDDWDDEDDDLDEVATAPASVRPTRPTVAVADDADEDDWDDEDDLDDWDDEDDDLDEVAAAPAPLRPTVAAEDDEDDWDDEDDLDDWDDEDDDLDEVATAPERRAPAVAEDDEDDWDDYDEEDAEEDRKWAEAEARIKAEQAARDAVDDVSHEEVSDEDASHEDATDAQDEMEATIDRLARESVRKTVKMTSPARVMLTEAKVEDSDTSVSRLLDQTDSELREPEGNRRRSAIAHLRAAVAATRADRILGRRRDEDGVKAAYQEDLEDAVRPRRPKAGGKTARPSRHAASEDRPAPLKLVAEQRIDAEEPTEAPAPRKVAVRPRRPAGGMAEPIDDTVPTDGGFAEFAENAGASALPQLLEAAAAYMSFVEGRDQFSRPQLMSKVRQAEASESSREDRLRSFGQLLREGKIQKTRGGRFTASEDIGFRPGDRAAG